MQDSGNSSKRSRRRRLSRDLSRNYPSQSSSNGGAGNLYPLQPLQNGNSNGHYGMNGNGTSRNGMNGSYTNGNRINGNNGNGTNGNGTNGNRTNGNGTSGMNGRSSNSQRANGQGASSQGQPPDRREISLPAAPRRPARPAQSGGFNLRNLLSNDSPERRRSRRDLPIRLPGAGSSNSKSAPGANHSSSSGSRSSLIQSRSADSRGLSRPNLTPVTPLVVQPSSRVRPLPVPAPPTRRNPRKSRPAKPVSPLLYVTRLLILGVGIGAIAGTVLHVWNPKDRPVVATTPSSSAVAEVQTAVSQRDTSPANPTDPIRLPAGQPLTALSSTIQGLINPYQGFQVGVFVVDQDNGNIADLRGSTPLQAASTIKVPILVAFLQDVEAGKVRLDEQLSIQQGDVADGSGEFQYLPVGERISALEVATKMITISDNTATNMLIRRLGGMEALNQRFRAWGLTNTAIKSALADLGGTNTTSARDLSMLLSGVAQGELLSLRSRDRLMQIMQGTVNNSLIPAGIGEGQQAVIAHKTGNISTMTGDTAIVDMLTGKRYVITVLVQKPADDERSQELVRQISAATYQYFQQNSTSGTASPPAATGAVATPTGDNPASENSASPGTGNADENLNAPPAAAPISPDTNSGDGSTPP